MKEEEFYGLGGEIRKELERSGKREEGTGSDQHWSLKTQEGEQGAVG